MFSVKLFAFAFAFSQKIPNNFYLWILNLNRFFVPIVQLLILSGSSVTSKLLIWYLIYNFNLFGLLNSILTQLIIPFVLYTLFSNSDTLLGLFLVAQLVRPCLQCRRPGSDPWVGKISWRRERLPIPIFWPGEFHWL